MRVVVTIYFKVMQEFSDAPSWCKTAATPTQPHDLSGQSMQPLRNIYSFNVTLLPARW
jgi:hypothetical protein